jgi:hypothetical protein
MLLLLFLIERREVISGAAAVKRSSFFGCFRVGVGGVSKIPTLWVLRIYYQVGINIKLSGVQSSTN